MLASARLVERGLNGRACGVSRVLHMFLFPPLLALVTSEALRPRFAISAVPGPGSDFFGALNEFRQAVSAIEDNGPSSMWIKVPRLVMARWLGILARAPRHWHVSCILTSRCGMVPNAMRQRDP